MPLNYTPKTKLDKTITLNDIPNGTVFKGDVYAKYVDKYVSGVFLKVAEENQYCSDEDPKKPLIKIPMVVCLTDISSIIPFPVWFFCREVRNYIPFPNARIVEE